MAELHIYINDLFIKQDTGITSILKLNYFLRPDDAYMRHWSMEITDK